jgi:hypothetical protein
MENTIQFNEINEVDLGDDTLIDDPTPGFGVTASTECTPDELVVEFRDGDGSVSGVGARIEGGFAAFRKKER